MSVKLKFVDIWTMKMAHEYVLIIIIIIIIIIIMIIIKDNVYGAVIVTYSC